VPVFEGVEPTAIASVDRQQAFAELAMGAPVATDAADQSSGGGVRFRFFEVDGDWAPHPGSGAVDGTFPRLNDGLVARHDDDTERCVWYDNEGRFALDLGASCALRSVNTYSAHRSDRAPQFFSLWGSNAEDMPSCYFGLGDSTGWTLLAVVDSRELGRGGTHGSAVVAKDGHDAFGPYRHLLWIAQDVGQGTFFTEIDVHLAK
jgi:alpha-mannosidase